MQDPVNQFFWVSYFQIKCWNNNSCHCMPTGTSAIGQMRDVKLIVISIRNPAYLISFHDNKASSFCLLLCYLLGLYCLCELQKNNVVLRTMPSFASNLSLPGKLGLVCHISYSMWSELHGDWTDLMQGYEDTQQTRIEMSHSSQGNILFDSSQQIMIVKNFMMSHSVQSCSVMSCLE